MISRINHEIRFALLVLLVGVAARSIPAHAAPIRLTDSFRIGVSTVGTGVADATKYKGAELAANTKQANDYAAKYSTDYTAFYKYDIFYTLVFGLPLVDPDMSSIIFSTGGFRTLPISLQSVTGDFEKKMFTRFEFQSVKWYPDLETDFNIKNDTLKGFIDLSDPKMPVVDITATYIWQETVSTKGVLTQPAATLTYKTTAKVRPGEGNPWDPSPPGPAAIPEPSSLLLMVLPVFGLFVWGSRIKPRRSADKTTRPPGSRIEVAPQI